MASLLIGLFCYGPSTGCDCSAASPCAGCSCVGCASPVDSSARSATVPFRVRPSPPSLAAPPEPEDIDLAEARSLSPVDELFPVLFQPPIAAAPGAVQTGCASIAAPRGVVQTGCQSCLPALPPPTVLGGCVGCGHGGCVAGRVGAFPCEANTRLGRLFCGFYECLFCPDPCYEPRWRPLADAAFFVNSARPVTQTRLRWDSGFNLAHPDRAEYFWAQVGGKGPPVVGDPRLNYQELRLYTEAATDRIGVFVEQPYRDVQPHGYGEFIGFGDLAAGAKTLLVDCELLQISSQFKTTTPTGVSPNGVGVGHVSLEPALLLGLRLAPDTYLQGELAYWIPIGGTPGFQGNIFHEHFSVNQVLTRFLPDVPLVGTMEVNHWQVLNGSYTDALGHAAPASAAIVSLGPGLRLFLRDKLDAGVGTAFGVSDAHWANQLVRADFRVRF
jgi:hypothetical protein